MLEAIWAQLTANCGSREGIHELRTESANGREVRVAHLGFSAAGRRDAQFRVFPSLNHLFFSGETVCMPTEYQWRASVDPELVNQIVRYIQRGSSPEFD